MNSYSQTIDEYFERDPFTEFWAAIADLRASADEGRVGQFVKLSERTSQRGDLGGFRIFSRLWPWRKEFAEVIVARDCGFDEHGLPRGYSVKVMRGPREEVVIFSTGDSLDDSKNLDAVVQEFSLIVSSLIQKAKSNTLKTQDFESWEGRHWRDVVREEYFEKNAVKHRSFSSGYLFGVFSLMMLMVLVGPFSAVSLSFFGFFGGYLAVLSFFRIDLQQDAFDKSRHFGLRTFGGILMLGMGVAFALFLYDPIISVSEFVSEFKERLFD